LALPFAARDEVAAGSGGAITGVDFMTGCGSRGTVSAELVGTGEGLVFGISSVIAGAAGGGVVVDAATGVAGSVSLEPHVSALGQMAQPESALVNRHVANAVRPVRNFS